jgi:Flp pilus assembly protein TadG
MSHTLMKDSEAGVAGQLTRGWSFLRTIRATGRKLDKVCRSYRKKRRGAAAVEFAVVAPIFLLLVFGMIEYGRMVMVQQILVNASREGARKAVLDGSTGGDVTQVVEQYLTGGSIDGANITVTPSNPEDAAFGDPVTVSVSVGFNQVSWLPSPMYLGGRTLSASTVMRRESVQ